MKIKNFITALLASAFVVGAMTASAMAVKEPEAPEVEETEVVLLEETEAEEEYVAFIGENRYTTIAGAIAAAQNGDVVTIAPGTYPAINISNKNITLQGTLGKDGEHLTVFNSGNPVITAHGFNGTIKDIKIVDAWKVFYAEPAGNITFDNLYVTGAMYGIHAVAYSEGLKWTIQNSYMDLRWANSFGIYGEGDADIIVKNNEFESTDPYYDDYGALFVNTFLPKVTVENNIFGKNAKIRIDASITDTSNINIGLNYYAEGAANAYSSDSGVTVPIYTEYTTADKTVVTPTAIVAATLTSGNEVNYFTSINEAIKAAKDGDTVTLTAGTHKGGFSVGGKNITLEGTLVDGKIATIINGDNGSSSYYRYAISMGVGTIRNLKIVNAWKGIFTESKSGSFTIENVEMVEIGYGIHIAEAKQETDVITVRNSNIDVTWANSFTSGPYSLVFENNVLTANNPYYGEGKPSPVVNSNVANTTISENIFGKNAKIYLNEEKVTNPVIGTNYYAESFENAFYSGSAIVPIYTEYTTAEKTETVKTSDLKATIGETYYPSIKAAVDAAAENAVIVVAPGTHTEKLNINKSVVLTGNPNYGTATLADENTALVKPVINISDVTNGGVQYYTSNVVFDNLVFNVLADATGTTWNVSALGFYYENTADKNGLTVTNCDFINNSNIVMSAIAANLATYTIKNNTFENFNAIVHTYVDHGALGTVIISDNTFANVDNIANVYWGAEAADGTLTITGNKSTDDSTAKIIVDDYGKTKTTPVTAISTATIKGNDAELCVHNYTSDNKLDTDEPMTNYYRTYELARALDGTLPNGVVYVVYYTNEAGKLAQYETPKMYIVTENMIKEEADSVELVFVENTTTDDLDNSVWDIVLVANEAGILNRLNSADFTFELTTDKASDDMAYEIVAVNSEIAINNVNNDANRFEFHYDGKDDVKTDTATRITIGQVRFTGYGAFTFKIVATDTNAVHTTTFIDNIVESYVVGGITDADGNVTNEFIVDGTIDSAILVPTTDLTINVTFPNAVSNQVSDYQKMSVTVSGGDLDKTVVVELGSTPVIPEVATDLKPNAVVTAKFENGAYLVNVEDLLTINTSYTVTVEGAGYRTYRYTVTMTDNKTLNFWNNVKDNDTVVEKDKKTEKVTYLAGDIVKDSLINIYDLSAVVSYFGETGLVGTKNDYAKYDLNRDGKIDSKDVAYVLVSWGN